MCARVRAVHLEIVQDLSTQSFLRALQRFVSHHGWPRTFISDYGKSLVGTKRELRKLFLEGRKAMSDFAVLHKIQWKFTTPHSPHKGGIYESLIKQKKQSLHVAIGSQVLSWNEMSTVFAEVESLINSRSLGYLSSDPNDPQPLTPNHLLLGCTSPCVPQGPFKESTNPRKCFAFIQNLAQQFWRRFLQEYIPTGQNGKRRDINSRWEMLCYLLISHPHRENGNSLWSRKSTLVWMVLSEMSW